MSTIDGIQKGNPLAPKNPLSIAPPITQQKKQAPPKSDGASISGEAKKKEAGGERKDLLKALKSNFGGNDRIQSNKRTLEKLSTDKLKGLKKRREFDKALTKHEEAHHEVAADLARSTPLYETEIGEDGQEYRKSGKVMIDTGNEKDDERTVKKMRQVRAAALAPDGNQLAPLSEQDKKVAREATEKEQKAQRRLDAKGSGAKIEDADKRKNDSGKGSKF